MEIHSFYDLDKEYQKLAETNALISIDCWVRTNRSSGKIGFLTVTDGTSQNMQVVYKKDQVTNFDEIEHLTVWTAIRVTGKVALRPKDNWYEINASKIEVLATCDPDFPLQNKQHSFEFLRDISHLRARSNLFNAIMRIRSEAAFAIHNYYHMNRFLYLNSPEISVNDGEGAGENFIVTTREDKTNAKFFGTTGYLTVSGQLHGEAYAQAFKDIYTFGPTFRAENSHTNRHISEFWMIEPEMAFSDFNHGIKIAEDTLKYVIKWVLEHCQYELEVCASKNDPTLIERLHKYAENPFPVVQYKDAIVLLKEHSDSGKVNFENKNIFFGLDLGSEHEKYLCEKVYQMPIFLVNYPKEIKAFYMKANPDQKTVAAFDCLVPGIGEVVGGSEREGDYNKLTARCEELKMNTQVLDWYINLRKYGYYKSVGFGIGFERMVMMLTAVENIRDVISFPRFPGSLKF